MQIAMKGQWKDNEDDNGNDDDDGDYNGNDDDKGVGDDDDHRFLSFDEFNNLPDLSS